MPVISDKDIKVVEKILHGVLAEGKTMTLTIDTTNYTYTVPTGKKFDFSLMLHGEVKVV